MYFRLPSAVGTHRFEGGTVVVSSTLSRVGACCVLALLTLLTAETASAQSCQLVVYPAFSHSETGKPIVDAATSDNCPDFSTQTHVWIGNVSSIYCYAGNKSGHECFHFHADGSHAEGGTLGFGWWTGYSKHLSSDVNGDWAQLGGLRSIPLYAGEPHVSEECEEWEMWNEQTGSCVAYNTPIIIPLARGRAMKLTSAERGVLFDMNADGMLDWTGWTDWNSTLAFLAIDRNGNGVIDNGSELFGDYTIEGARNGFIALQSMNMELNGGVPRASINADEPLFERLLLWEDANHNGISESHELQPAATLLSDIGLGYMEHKRRDGHGNLLKWKGWASVRTRPGRNEAMLPDEQEARRIDIFDVYFVTKR